jgi:hypothetical protein
MSVNGLVVDTGRTLMARLLSNDPTLVQSGLILGARWYAIGTGSWTDKNAPPVESATQTGLTVEYARRRISRSAYLTMDNITGTIPYGGNLYVETPTPTPLVAFYTTFIEGEATDVGICEEGIFGDAVTTLADPYALVGQVTSPGKLIWVRNRAIYTKQAQDTFSPVAIFEVITP